MLRINKDETSVKLWVGGGAGCVAPPSAVAPALPLEQRVTLRARRAAFSYVCFVCDAVAVQPLLPQVIVASEKTIPAAVGDRFQSVQTGRIFLVRRKSAWLNARVLCSILRLLAECLAEAAPGRHIVLGMDACPVHLSPAVLRAAGKLGLCFLLLPALTTKYLQPCDVAVFARLKHRYRQLFADRQLSLKKAELPPQEVLEVLSAAVADIVVGGAWSGAFDLCGLRRGGPTTKRFQKALGTELPARFGPATLPTLAQFQAIFPANKSVPFDDLFRGLLCPPPLAPAAAKPPAARAPSPPFLDPERPWYGRTRSTASLAALTAPAPRAATGIARWKPRAVPLPAPRPPRAPAPPRPLAWPPRGARLPPA